MSLFKFDPKPDITTYELALIVKSFLLIMHGEGPGNNLEIESQVIDFLKKLDDNLNRHFDSVEGYD